MKKFTFFKTSNISTKLKLKFVMNKMLLVFEKKKQKTKDKKKKLKSKTPTNGVAKLGNCQYTVPPELF